MSALVLHVRLHDGRYHGQGDWPPSPARLFQALVAGAGLGGPIGVAEKKALEWLEEQKAPLVGAPPAWRPRPGVRFFMPNNDSDAIAGDPLRMPKIRTATKVFRPYCFDAAVPFVYAWPLAEAEDESPAREICSLAERLYQLGRGIDMAWAWGEILDNRQLDELLAVYPGRVFRPSAGKSTIELMSPCPGSVASLNDRHALKRFNFIMKGESVEVVFRKPPKPRFRLTPYDSPPSRQLYELRSPDGQGTFAPWPLTRATALVVALRDGAVQRLSGALSARKAEIERVLVGRKPDGTNDGRPEDRVRIIPLPSIGHVHADREIRRVLVHVPPTCPLRAADVHWAFSGLNVADVEAEEIQAVLTPTDDEGFLRHYGLEDDRRHRVWRTVTPAALPEDARRRRIDPARQRDEAKAGRERAWEQARAASAVCQALRHAGVRTGVEAIRVQREPFDTNGARVEAFALGTRFAKERLWHVEVRFSESVKGPLVIGDGRFLGLGVMAPVLGLEGVHGFAIESGLSEKMNELEVVRTFRRAVMARVQQTLEDATSLPPFFSGQEPDGAPTQSERHSHLAFAFDPLGKRLLVLAPHVIDRRAPTPDERTHLDRLWRALTEMSELKVGSAGLLKLHHTFVDVETDPLFAVSRHWESVTPYLVTRHARGFTPQEALAADLRTQCRRRGLPAPRVVIVEWRGLPRVGLEGRAVLHFNVAVAGPLLLGRSRYKGGGVFRCVPGLQALP
jgi:CRISPR-associated protein Csb2